jgi:VWFA-related protein
MRRVLVVGIFLAGTLHVYAAHRLSVSQLEQRLAADMAKHHSDADIAQQLGNFELTERLTDKTLQQLIVKLNLQPRTALAVELLGDQSSLLDPPRSELPATAPPDLATQQSMLSAARDYVARTIPRLPNFFATRTTIRFDDTAQVLHPGEWPVRAGFHPVGTRARTVTVRDGREVTDAAQEQPTKSNPEIGLYSFGEFGPILARTLTDLGKGKISFSHWEDSPLGVVAVFRYSVPKHESHYQVHFCCILDREFVGAGSYHSRNLPRYHSGDPNQVETTGMNAYDVMPAYHGTLAIDPATGAIARMTLDAQLDPDNPIMSASTVVEYGRVIIGDQPFICPVRSLAISLQHGPPPANGEVVSIPILSINETNFTQYHRLGSSARLIADGSVPAGLPGQQPGTWAASPSPIADASSAPPSGPETVAASAQPPSAAPPADPAPPATTHGAETPAGSVTPVASARPPADPATPAIAGAPAPIAAASTAAAEAPPPEISVSPSASLADVPPSSAPGDNGFSLHVTSRLVDVSVIALDRKGHPVTDLTANDFELYDNGRKQELKSFSIAGAADPPAAQTAPASTAADVGSFSNRATDSPASGTAPGQTILLIDESHLAWNDLNYARGQMLKFLAALPPGQAVGLYAMNGLGFRVLQEPTQDHSAVTDKLKAFLPSAQSMSEAQEEERRNRQQFATGHNSADLDSVNGNHGDSPDGAQPVDPELMRMGASPGRAALIVLAQVARHLAAIAGHKSLVWVSSDNVLADWRDQAVGTDRGPAGVESFAVRVQEAMNEAHAAIYPVDASGLEGGGVTADLQHSSIELEQAAADNAATAASAGAAGGSGSVARGNRDTGTGRLSAQLSQDAHAIQGVIRNVASATGGQVVGRTSDLAAALATISVDGRATYELTFAPQGSADDRYHALTLKVAGRKGVTLRYRTGYLFAGEPTTLKDRFRDALWRPADSSDIGITASVEPAAAEGQLRLKIAASDLALRQQDGRWMDKLDIFLVQRDDAGVRAQLDGQTLGLRLLQSTYQKALGDGIPFERSVEMRPGMASVRVLVVDENSGRIGSVTVPATALHPAR